MNQLLLMMGGQGTRFGANIPKQYILIQERPIFSYIVNKYATVSQIDRMILISHKDWVPYVKEQMEQLSICIPWLVVEGGVTRSESVLNGLVAACRLGTDEDVVLIHDATHPYVDIKGTREIISAVKQYGGATLGGVQYDTMYQTTADGFIEKIIPRQFVVSGASPEAFRLKEIYDIYARASKEELESMTSAGAIARAHNIPMKVIPSGYLNLKITHPEDMVLFELLMDNYFFK